MRKRLLLALPACLLAYLAGAAAWAWASFDAAVAAAGMPQADPLSAQQRRILLRVEDPAFFEHAGVSLAAGTGLATISTSVARDLFLDGPDLPGARGALQAFYRGVFRCCKRIDLGRDAMGIVVDARMAKEAQLALYVSRVYMGTLAGEEIRGLPLAARRYLGKDLAQTTPDEFAGLVGMIKAPNRYHPLRDPAAFVQRKARVAALAAGRCRPAGWSDTALDACADAPQAVRARSE